MELTWHRITGTQACHGRENALEERSRLNISVGKLPDLSSLGRAVQFFGFGKCIYIILQNFLWIIYPTREEGRRFSDNLIYWSRLKIGMVKMIRLCVPCGRSYRSR